MKRSELRDKIDNAIDDIEEGISNILTDLEEIEDKATWDTEALSKDDIEELQTSVVEAIKDLKELLEALY